MLMDANNIIEKYCGDIRTRLQACRSRSVALALKERLCTELHSYCISEMVNNVLKKHVDEMIDDLFDEQGKNKLLEKKDEKD